MRGIYKIWDFKNKPRAERKTFENKPKLTLALPDAQCDYQKYHSEKKKKATQQLRMEIMTLSEATFLSADSCSNVFHEWYQTEINPKLLREKPPLKVQLGGFDKIQVQETKKTIKTEAEHLIRKIFYIRK